MGAGAWKVAYADFMTAMMAFFLLMWILNMATPETKTGLADFFTEGATSEINMLSPVGARQEALKQYSGKLSTLGVSEELRQNHLAIMRALTKALDADALPSASSGIEGDNTGVLLHITPDVMFRPNSTDLSAQGKTVLKQVLDIMQKYQCYLVVRGHADKSETGAPRYPSSWELSAARSNTVVSYLISLGANPTLLRSVAYGTTKPNAPASLPNAALLNSRVDFLFHRPEVMSTVTNF